MQLAIHETKTSATRTPAEEYRFRLAVRRHNVERQSRQEGRIGNARVAVFLAAGMLAWLVFGARALPPWTLALPVAAFGGLLVWHERVRRDLFHSEQAAAYYQRGLDRLEGHWSGRGIPGTRFLDPEHPNAPDLDLFGTGSLFELLCTARTRRGEDTLAAWLLAPARQEEVLARQEAVAELRPRLDLREELALLGADVPPGVDLEALVAWGAAPPLLVSRSARLTALVLSVLAVMAAGWAFLSAGPTPFLIVLLVETVFAWWWRRRVLQVIAVVERRARDLALFAGVLARLERERFAARRLRQLRAALDTAGLPPSRRIVQLFRLIDWLNSRRNQFFALLAPALFWTTQFAFAIEAWRRLTGPAIARWLAVVGEFEALSALAAYAYENPEDPFPEVLPGGACFAAEGIGHPLLARDRCIRNDVELSENMRVLVVSGSNMSGKSTLLRTIGINAVLALTGAPVRATRLQLSPLVVGATLRIQDSLQAGRSRFFAEITRVRQLMDLAGGPVPLLFMLDEVFHGTNSHDRRLGAEAVVRGLVRRGAVGLITTHDLALTHIAELLAPHAANVHFQDRFENGALTFDYLMRPGVVQHSNALALMRAVGLEV